MDPDERWDSLVVQADTYRRAGKAHELRRVAQDLIGCRPEEELGYRMGGEACIQDDEYEQAVGWMTKAVEADPEYDHALYRLAVAHRLQGSTAKAEQYLNRALEIDPNCAWYWVELGWISDAEDDHVGAERYARCALALEAEHVGALQLLAGSLKKGGRAKHAERVLVLDQALAVDPEDADVWDDKALLLLDMGEVKDAEHCARQALLLAPESKHYRETLYKALKRSSWTYRILRWPGDMVRRGFGLIDRMPWWGWTLLVLMGVGWRFLLALLLIGVLWFLFVYPVLKMYEWTSLAELRRAARELPGRRAGFHGLPRPLRMLAFFGLTGAFWSLIWFLIWTDEGGDVIDVVSGLVVLFFLLSLPLGAWRLWRDSRRAKRRQRRADGMVRES